MGSPPTYGMNTRGLPGTLAPTYQELAVGNSVPLASSLTWSTQASSDSTVASMAPMPLARRNEMQSAIQSTCCSMLTTMLLSTEGLPGPVTMNRLGKPAV